MILLGAGNFGMWFIVVFNDASMPLFLEKFAISKFMTGFVIGLPGIAVCTIPPIVGYISDRTRGRFGRRRPYIFSGALVALVCCLALPHAGTYAAVVLAAGAMHFAAAFADTPYLALLGDVAPPHQRSTASGYMQFMGSLGSIVFVAVASQIWDNHPTETIYLVGIVFAASMLTTIAFIKEPKTPPAGAPQRTNFSKHLKSIFRETNAMKLLAAETFAMAGFLVIYPFLTLFSVDDLGVSEGNSLFVMLANAVSILIFVLPLGMLGDRVGRKPLLSLVFALNAALHFLFFFAQDFTQVLIISGLVGIPIAGMMGIGYAFFLDLIPEGRTAEFVGLFSVAMGIPLFVGPLVGGRLVDMIGYRALFVSGPVFMIVAFIIFQFVRDPRADGGA